MRHRTRSGSYLRVRAANGHRAGTASVRSRPVRVRGLQARRRRTHQKQSQASASAAVRKIAVSYLVFRGELHQALQELSPGQRVAARDRLVEYQQLGPLGDRDGQRELGSLAAGQLAHLLPGVEAELSDPALRQARVQPGFMCAPSRRWSATVSPA